MRATHLIDGTFGNSDRKAAEKIIAENSHKPIRKMVPTDFSAG